MLKFQKKSYQNFFNFASLSTILHQKVLENAKNASLSPFLHQETLVFVCLSTNFLSEISQIVKHKFEIFLSRQVRINQELQQCLVLPSHPHQPLKVWHHRNEVKTVNQSNYQRDFILNMCSCSMIIQ